MQNMQQAAITRAAASITSTILMMKVLEMPGVGVVVVAAACVVAETRIVVKVRSNAVVDGFELDAGVVEMSVDPSSVVEAGLDVVTGIVGSADKCLFLSREVPEYVAATVIE